MLEASWETHATTLSNAHTTDELIDALETLVRNTKIDLSKPARVVYARDTRPSGVALIAALEDGFTALGAQARNAGVTTTPILHYLVLAINTKDTPETYGDDSEEGYFQKLSDAFKNLIVRRCSSRSTAASHVYSPDGNAPSPWSSTARTASVLSLRRR